MTESPSLERLFHAARELPKGAERDAYLERACGEDRALREKVDALLRAQAEATRVFGAAEGAGGDAGAAADAHAEVADDPSRYRRLRHGAEQSAGAQSVIAMLQARAETRIGVHLDEPEEEEAPTLVTEQAKRLREPSGRYQMLGELGRGGVGVVYKGRDMDLGRDVAIKVLKDEHARRPDLLARFVEEAQVGGQLQHPGIVPVYELGLNVGEQPFFAMKLVKGETLAAQLAARSEPSEDLRRLLGVFEQICQTLAYAHARRVVHRDLKPANVMIGAFGEVQVVDWGLSKVLPKGGVVDEQASIDRDEQLSVIDTVRTGPGAGSESLAGSRIGTPAYMPPEQALGDIDRLDQRSDVFGLGAILCEILTGAPPYRRVHGDVLRQAAMGALDQAYERIAACGADEAMVALCCACLAREPQDRPKDASELAAAMQAYFTAIEERVHAARLEAAEARVRAVAERKARRLTLALALSGLTLIAVVAGFYLRGAQREETRLARERERLEDERQREDARQVRLRGRLEDERRVAIDLQEQGRFEEALSVARRAAAMAEDERADEAARAGAQALVSRADAAMERAARTEGLRAQLEAVRALETRTVEELADGQQEDFDAAFADAFRSFGIAFDLEEEERTNVIEDLRATGLAEELALALDQWARLRRGLRRDEAEVLAVVGLAHDLDPNEKRGEVREALLVRDGDWLAELAGDEACLEEPWTLLVLIEALRELGHSSRARELADLATRLHPGDFRLRWNAGWWLWGSEQDTAPYSGADRRRPDLALPHFVAALALRPDDLAVLAMVAMAELESGELLEARAHMLSALDREPRLYRLWRVLGPIDIQLGNFGAAVRNLERAVEAWPVPEIQVQLCVARYLAGELSREEFEAALQPFHALTPQAMQAWMAAAILQPQPPESMLLAAWDSLELELVRKPALGVNDWMRRALVASRVDRPEEVLRAVAAVTRMATINRPLEMAAGEFMAAMARQRLGEGELARESYDRGKMIYERFASGREEQLARSFAARLGEEARVALGL